MAQNFWKSEFRGRMRLKSGKICARKMENGTGYDQVPFFGLQLLANEAFDEKITIITS